jgi:putative DNA primase/helicase
VSTADVFNAPLSGEPACSFFSDGADHGHPGPYIGRPSDDPKHFFCRFCMQEHTEPQPDAPTSATARAAYLDVANAERFPPDLRFNDVDNSTRFVHLHGDRIRYVIEWGTWIVWAGTRWLIDRNNVAVSEFAKSVPAALYRQAAGEDAAAAKQTAGWANRSATRGQIAAMVDLARGIEGVVISHTELDTDPWLLGVRNGYIDLRDGTFHEPDPAKLIPMQTPTGYDPDAEAPRWAQALVEWFPDEPLREGVQRLSGHALSGDPLGDHIFVIQHGDGRNGKGTFNRAHKHVLGPYYVTPDKSLLIQKRHDEHPTVKARLFRTRLAVASETEQRERLNEARPIREAAPTPTAFA